MSIFRPGLRVRILYSIGFPELAGEEGTIVEELEDTGGMAKHYGIPGPYWLVAPDAWGGFECPYEKDDGIESFSPSEQQLAPIQPEGYALSTWDQCVWRPKPARTRQKSAPQREGAPA